MNNNNEEKNYQSWTLRQFKTVLCTSIIIMETNIKIVNENQWWKWWLKIDQLIHW